MRRVSIRLATLLLSFGATAWAGAQDFDGCRQADDPCANDAVIIDHAMQELTEFLAYSFV